MIETDVIAKGQKAATFLSDGLWETLSHDINEKLIDQIKKSLPEDKDGREYCYYMMKYMELIQELLEKYSFDGTVEQKDKDKSWDE